MDSYPANTKETQDILGIIPHVTIEEGTIIIIIYVCIIIVIYRN